jgi:2-polyprenyl-6-methoxyphenol hydroxylase-like FAD-dependent oxidoreductase
VAEHIFSRDLPYGYAWIFPAVGGIANVGVYLTQDAYRGSAEPLPHLFDRFVSRHAERFDGAERVGRLRTWSLPLAPSTVRTSAPGLLFAGDAGRFIDPLTGEGIWQALYTGALAGRIAAEATLTRGLTPVLRARFDFACARRIGIPSVGKAATQSALRWLIRSGLYGAAPVRAALAWGYTGNLLDLSRQPPASLR